MKLNSSSLFAAVLITGSAAIAQTVINDGTTTTDLTIAYTAGAGAAASASTNGSLVSFSGTTSSTANFRWRGVAYENTASGLMTGNNYSVSASFNLSANAPTNYTGGVVGLFNTASNVGIFFGVQAGSSPTATIRLQEWDVDLGFSAGLSTANFRELDGTAFVTTGFANIGTRNAATFTLQFTPATAQDIANWGSATTRVTATATGGVSISKTFLTSLNPATSRVGYGFGGDGASPLGTSVATNTGFAFDNLTVTPIPEPSSFAALAGLGALGFVASRRRRRD